ncbi:MAG: hypothetical protein JRI89_16770, partial [Deltaproteobacteria bacterium]|nr:hypothetical protein [Deltaproteobacteria bacterium]
LQYDERKIVEEIQALGWQPPADTDSNSSNCLLNSLGIESHLQKFGFHPYAFELAGLVREGYLSRAEGLARLAARPDEKIVSEVKRTLAALA